MRRRARKLWLAARRAGGIDILLTHAPASGLNDGTDKAHKGFQVFNDLMDLYQPKWFIHGHMHLNYGANLPRVCTRGGTTVINATERYEFEIPDPVQVPKRKLFGLPLSGRCDHRAQRYLRGPGRGHEHSGGRKPETDDLPRDESAAG